MRSTSQYELEKGINKAQHNTSWKRASTKHNTHTMELGKTTNIRNERDKIEHTIGRGRIQIYKGSCHQIMSSNHVIKLPNTCNILQCSILVFFILYFGRMFAQTSAFMGSQCFQVICIIFTAYVTF